MLRFNWTVLTTITVLQLFGCRSRGVHQEVSEGKDGSVIEDTVIDENDEDSSPRFKAKPGWVVYPIEVSAIAEVIYEYVDSNALSKKYKSKMLKIKVRGEFGELIGKGRFYLSHYFLEREKTVLLVAWGSKIGPGGANQIVSFGADEIIVPLQTLEITNGVDPQFDKFNVEVAIGKGRNSPEFSREVIGEY